MTQLNINMDPQEALDNINAHDHTSGLGNQITTASIVNNAVTADKLAASAVTTEKIASNAVTTEKVADGSITAGKIAAGVLASSEVVGLTDYIGQGAKIKPNADLTIAVEPLEASIAGAYQQTSADTNVSLDARKASLIYAQKGTGGIPVLGKVNAVYPEADEHTVLRYTFNEVGNPQDTSSNENHITTMVGCTRADGWVDYAKQGDGSTGYMVSGATTGFPTGASERQLTVLFTCKKLGATQVIAEYGTVSSTNVFCLYLNTSNNIVVGTYTVAFDTGFTVENGKTYLIDVTYDGINVKVYVNGRLICVGAVTLNTTTTVLNVGNRNSTAYYCGGIFHYLELRNKVRTPAQIGQIANKLCLPCRYTGPNASYPTILEGDLLLDYHEYKFDEISGTSVADSAGTLNGTATGTTIVDSEIGLGKSRKMATTGDFVTLGSMAFATDWTVIHVGQRLASGTYDVDWILSNRNSGATSGMVVYIDNSGYVSVNAGSSGIVAVGKAITGCKNFIAATSKSSDVSFYVNSPYVDSKRTLATNTTTGAAYLGHDAAGTSYGSNQQHDYTLYIPRALTQSEIAQYYYALMKTAEKDIREILPADSISLGFARTNSTVVTEINDTDYKFGRREGATGGNRKVFLGWKYFTTNTALCWKNPFGTKKVNFYINFAEDALGRNESVTNSFYVYSSGYDISRYTGVDDNFNASVSSCGINTIKGVVTSGYLGCYAEVIE